MQEGGAACWAALAALARKFAATNCQHVDAQTASRLSPLDKKPGCRPIGIGKSSAGIIGKYIMAVVKEDVRITTGNLQVCAGKQAGGKTAIHAMRKIFGQNECEMVMLVDVKNAFNTLNRKTMLHNIRVKCPSLATYVENTYSDHSDNVHSCLPNAS